MALYPKKRRRNQHRPASSRPAKAYKNVPQKQIKSELVDINKNLAVGVAIHSNVNARTATNVLENVNDYQNPDIENREKVVTLSRKLRSVEGVCSTVADLLADFAVTKGFFESDNEELKVLLNKWADTVNGSPDISKQKGVIFPVPGLRAVSRRIFDDYITDGDSVFTLFWQQGVKIDPQEGDSYFLPTAIKTIDSLSLEIDEDLAKIGVEQLQLVLDDNVIKRIQEPTTEADKFLTKSMPKEWVKFINAGEPIILDPNVTYHLKRNGKDWKAWGEPLFLKAFTAVAAKRRIQAVDDATIDGLINRFTIFKLGLPDREKNPAYHIPSNARVQGLIDILQTPKRANAAVWPGPDLDVIDIGPDGKVLEFHQKYKQADIDILRALHVPPLLIDGASAGQSAKDWASFVSTEVGLDAIRGELEKLYMQIAKEIALANNMQYEELYYRFDTQLLKDEKTVRNFALKVFELGGLSIETFVKTMGYSFDTEKRLKEQEESDGVAKLFVNPNVPGFTGVPAGQATPVEPDGGEGRPQGQPDEQQRAAASSNPLDDVTIFYDLYSQAFREMQKNVTSRLLATPDDTSFAEMALVSGFSQFRNLVESQLRTAFLKVTGGNITDELGTLLRWNEGYINAFYSGLKMALKDSPETFVDTLKANEMRVLLYAQEGHKKAFWLGSFAMARLKGKTEGTWVCSSVDSACAEHDGKKYSLVFLAENFPGHPNCLCKVDLES